MKPLFSILWLMLFSTIVNAEDAQIDKVIIVTINGAGPTLVKSKYTCDFSMPLDLQTSGPRDNYKKLESSSSILIHYSDGSTENVPLNSLKGTPGYFSDVAPTGVIYTYHMALGNLLNAKNQVKVIESAEIKFSNGKQNATATLTKSSPQEGQEREGLTECTCSHAINSISSQATDNQTNCGSNREFPCTTTTVSPFGEFSCYYTRHQKTFIYDFNKDISKRGFFLVKRNKAGNLEAQPVNIGRQHLRPRDNVVFKVLHVNRFMYNVSIADTLVDEHSEPSPLFSNFFIGDSSLMKQLIGVFSKNIGGGLSGTSQAKGVNGKVIMTPLMCKIQCFMQSFNSLQTKMLQAYNPCSQFPCCTAEDYQSLASDLLEIKILTAQDESILKKLQKDLDDKQTTLEKSNASQKTLDGLAKQLADIKKKKAEDITADDQKVLDQEAKLKKGILDETSLTTLNKSIADLKDQLKSFDGVKELHDALPGFDDLKRVVLFLNNMVEQNQNYMTEITSLDGNRLDLLLNISAKDSIGKLVPAMKDFQLIRHIDIPIIWKPFVSFSSGSFLGLGYNLQNKTYDWRPLPSHSNVVDDSSKFELVESGYSQLPAGFAAFGNLEWKASRAFGIGASVGVGLTIESNPRIAYLGGASLFFGDRRQFAVTGGILSMQVNRLKNNLTAGQLIYGPSNRPTIEYYKEFNVAGFVSVSYTPFTERRKR